MTLGFIVLLPLPLTGCKTEPVAATMEPAAKKDYSDPLPPGSAPLRLVQDQAQFKALLDQSYPEDDPMALEAAMRSAAWFDKPSSRQFYPIDNVTFGQAREGAKAMVRILQSNPSKTDFAAQVMKDFDLWESVGTHGSGIVLFTGYCAMDFDASMVQTDEFKYPLYKRPADLVTDPVTGETIGRKVGSGTVAYPTRREIESTGMLKGTELVWLKSPLDAYFIQVNGSAKLWLPDGSKMFVGYSGTNGRNYTGLGATMLKRGIVDPSRVGIPFIKKYYKEHPKDVMDMIDDNERFVFFTTYPQQDWPAGSLGVRVTDQRTLATDKSIFPRGGPVIIATRIPTYYSGKTQDFQQLMFDQDTGGAIRAPGRADIYMGAGGAAALLAGRQYQEGHLYYLIYKGVQKQDGLPAAISQAPRK